MMYTAMLIIVTYVVTYTEAGRIDICQWETFEASCQVGEVILMKEAQYGRMRIGRCQPRKYFVGCSADVTNIMHTRCSGRQHCKVPIPDPAMFAATPCPKDLVTYLEADYKCVKVSKPKAERHCDDEILVGQTGYISNPDISSTTNSICPHRILAQPGQTINVYLYDFYSIENKLISDCINYGSISEDKFPTSTICGGDINADRLVYSSKNNIVDIALQPSQVYNYLLRYKIIGCPSLEAPANSQVKVAGNKAVVTCNSTSIAGNLICIDNQWIGKLRNCSKAGTPTAGSLNSLFADSGMTLVCVGLVLGIMCAVGLFALGLTYIGYRRNKIPVDEQDSSAICESPNGCRNDVNRERSRQANDQYQPVYVPPNTDNHGSSTSITPVRCHSLRVAMPVHECGHTIHDLVALTHNIDRKKRFDLNNACPV